VDAGCARVHVIGSSFGLAHANLSAWTGVAAGGGALASSGVRIGTSATGGWGGGGCEHPAAAARSAANTARASNRAR